MKSNDVQFVVFSSKRSTHHAFLEGVLKGRGYIYKNNCMIKNEGNVVPQKIVCEGDEKVLAASFEQGFSLDVLEDGTIYESLGMDIQKVKKIVYLRDPLNTAASTYSIYKKVEKYDMGFVERNLEHYCSVFNSLNKFDGYLFVYANKFWAELLYRNAALESIGFLDPLVSYNTNQSYFGGGGNSFFDNKEKVSHNDLSSRFLKFKEDKEFRGLVEKYELDQKANYLSEEFGDFQLKEHCEKFFK